MIDLIELNNRAGDGVAIIVEGRDDLFYSDWFGGERRVAFFGNGGWQEVAREVARLREIQSAVPVFGILDRDFTDEEELSAEIHNGLIRTSRYTIENYFTDAEIWYTLLQRIFRRSPDDLPQSWQTVDSIAEQIDALFVDCLSVAAFNFAAKSSTGTVSTYAEHPKAVDARLNNANSKFQELYRRKLAELESADLQQWQQNVSGKVVLNELHRRLPKRTGKGQFDLNHYLDLYLNVTFDQPPDDLKTIVNLILQVAGR